MSNDIANTIDSTSKSAKIWGVVAVILGLIAIATPFVAGLAVAMTLGIVLLLAGIAQTLFAFQAGTFGKGLLRLLFGVITIVFGVAVLSAPAAGLASLTIVLAAYFLVDGIFTVIAAFQLKPASGWGWMVFNGVITVLLSWMIWSEWPISAAWAAGVLVGVRLIMTGMTMVTFGSAGSAIGRELGRAG
jgi:uncharacterized membrane protein HdeD (DUF308 family)